MPRSPGPASPGGVGRARRTAWAMALLCAVTWGWAQGARAQGALRLVLRPVTQAAQVGVPLALELELRGPDGLPARAPQELGIRVRVVGDERETLVVLPAGQAAVRTSVTPPRAGILEIRAEHRQLLPGSCFVKASRIAGLLDPGRLRAVPASFAGVRALPARPAPRLLLRVQRRTAVVLTRSNETALATGADPVEIQAFLDGAPAAEPLTLLLAHSGVGRLSEAVLRVPQGGENSDVARLTSAQVGSACVRYVGELPVAGPDSICVTFEPPIVGITVTSSPDRITLLEHSTVTATLRGADGVPLSTARPRAVGFRIAGGGGELSEVSAEIPAGKPSAVVTFSPARRGAVRVVASVEGLLDQGVDLRVRLPVAALLVCALGGAVGVWLPRARRRSRWRLTALRALAGAVPAVVLYWYALSGGLLLKVSSAWLLNPVTAFAIAVVGGALGTGVVYGVGKALRVPFAAKPGEADATRGAQDGVDDGTARTAPPPPGDPVSARAPAPPAAATQAFPGHHGPVSPR